MFIDHDLHIHSRLSTCSNDPAQTYDAILAYAKKNGFGTVCVTDHYWDEKVPGASGWYEPQNTENIRRNLPLPTADGIRFLFGCETEMDRYGTIGITKERAKEFDFVIIPTTHMHMAGFTVRGDEDAKERGELWVSRFEKLLESDLPLEKCGIAHLTCPTLPHGRGLLDTISDEDMIRLFARAAGRGLGIELNCPWNTLSDEILPSFLRPYRIAKAEGCRFYLGGDSHHPQDFDEIPGHFARITALLELDDTHKFMI